MRVSEAFPSKYLAGDDLKGRRVEVTIREVLVEEVGEDKDEKPVLYFQDKKKGMILNKTNAAVLADAYGDETEDWTGRRVELRTEKVQFQGKLHNALRVQALETEPDPPDDGEAPF